MVYSPTSSVPSSTPYLAPAFTTAGHGSTFQPFSPRCFPGPLNSSMACWSWHAALTQGGAPEGLKFVDTEEEWVVDPATGQGAWLPVKR